MFKKFLLPFVFLIMLLSQEMAFRGASNGLNLWFNTIVPTLFPFMIISCLLQNVYGNRFRYPIPYVMVIGFLCGYPMGAYAATTAYKNGRLTKGETYLLLMACNISSPAFLFNFIFHQNLGLSYIPIKLLLPCYLPSFLVLMVLAAVKHPENKWVPIYPKKRIPHRNIPTNSENKPSDTPLTMNLLDHAVYSSVINVLKLGAYIILFSTLAEFIEKIPLHNSLLLSMLIGCAEITTGVHHACQTGHSLSVLIPLLLCMNSFGGLSCIMQTGIFFQGTDLDIKKYMYSKVLLAGLTFLIWYLLVHVFHIALI